MRPAGPIVLGAVLCAGIGLGVAHPAPAQDADDPIVSPAVEQEKIRDGQELYEDGCASCHGERAEGMEGTGPAIGEGDIQGAGPSLREVGPETIEFYLSTGYMPLRDAREQPRRSPPSYDTEEIDALIAFIQSLGKPGPLEPHVAATEPDGDVAEGMALFTDNCAGCHQVVGEGGIIDQGIAPELESATPAQIGQAVRIGPYMMPRFTEKQLSDDQVDAIAAYIDYTKNPNDAGGWGIGHIGPIPEGLAAWIIAGVGLVGLAVVIGKRIRLEEE